MNQKDLDNMANQKNPNHWRYWKARGYSDRPDNWIDLIDDDEYDSDDANSLNNRANQKNPNHKSYWTSRGYSDRPENWRVEVDTDEYEPQDEMKNITFYRNPVQIDSDEYESEDEIENHRLFRNRGGFSVARGDTAGTIANNDSSSSSLAAWIGGSIIVGVGLLSVAAAVGEAISEDSRERRRRNQRNEEN